MSPVLLRNTCTMFTLWKIFYVSVRDQSVDEQKSVAGNCGWPILGIKFVYLWLPAIHGIFTFMVNLVIKGKVFPSKLYNKKNLPIDKQTNPVENNTPFNIA